MLKRTGPFLLVLALIVLMVGCSSSGVKVRAYRQEKERVDLDFSGNAGYIYGAPPPEDLKVKDKTRGIFVLEVSKEPSSLPDKYYGIETVEKTTENVYVPPAQPKRKVAPKQEPEISLPSFSDDTINGEPTSENNGTFVNYTVEKDDTLQKIAKKFYGSFSQWPQIYEANREKIKSPDFIQPGIELRIPVQQK